MYRVAWCMVQLLQHFVMVMARENDTWEHDLYSNLSWKILWNGHDCGKNLGNVDLETSIHAYYRLSYINTTVECEIFQLSDSLMADYTKCTW